MRLRRMITTVDTHTAGEPTRIITGGLPPLHGATMADKRRFFETHFDDVRRLLTQEPRGHTAMHIAVLTAPSHPDADAAALIANAFGYLNMCGHGTLGVATALVELNMVPVTEPVTHIIFETLGGIIPLDVAVVDQTIQHITFRNLPAFSYRQGVEIEVPAVGSLSVDIVYGGLWYVIVEAEHVGLRVDSEHIDDLLRMGRVVREAVNRQVDVRDPETDAPVRVDLTLFTGPPDHPDAHARNVVTMGQRIYDRSPGGTGTSARMIALWASGKLQLGEDFVHESIVGTLFRGRLVEETMVAGIPGAIPEITGQAYITGFHQFVLDADDTLSDGFLVGGA